MCGNMQHKMIINLCCTLQPTIFTYVRRPFKVCQFNPKPRIFMQPTYSSDDLTPLRTKKENEENGAESLSGIYRLPSPIRWPWPPDENMWGSVGPDTVVDQIEVQVSTVSSTGELVALVFPIDEDGFVDDHVLLDFREAQTYEDILKRLGFVPAPIATQKFFN